MDQLRLSNLPTVGREARIPGLPFRTAGVLLSLIVHHEHKHRSPGSRHEAQRGPVAVRRPQCTSPFHSRFMSMR